VRTRIEKLGQACLVKIAHWRLAAGLDPLGMLPSQVVVNLLLKLRHGVDPVADYRCLERSLVCGEHKELDKRSRGFVHVWLLREQGDQSVFEQGGRGSQLLVSYFRTECAAVIM
jgi:hypothetical protein